MPRIRTIKPSFFLSEDVSALPLRARLTWIGLWTQCDDQGRAKDNAKLIKAGVWPLDEVSLKDIEEDLDTLDTEGRIVRYEVDGRRFLAITNWGDHQSINRPSESKIPSPDEATYPQVNAHRGLTEDSHQEGKGKEGKGRDARADTSTGESRCEKHKNHENPPNCHACRQARQAAETAASDADKQHKADTRACKLCNIEGWRYEPGRRVPITPYVRCDHQPQQREAS